jgi:two-component system chemotaxis response regulator CheY
MKDRITADVIGGVMTAILLIDADGHALAALRRTLERAGYTVLEAYNGREGLQRYRTAPTEVVITDILMPEQDGLETIRALRRQFPEVKLIAISGGGRTVHMDFLDVAERLGVHCTLHKPFDA